MRRPLPSLTALRAFEAAARHGSFTRAADELGVTQGAISHQIRQLERELRYPVFRKDGRGVALTEDGVVLARALTAALDQIAEALHQVDRQRSAGSVNVSASPSFAVCWLVPRLDAFQATHPDIDIRISATDRVVDPSAEGVDVCIRYGPGRYPGYDVRELTRDRVFPVCSPRLLEGPDALSRPADLRRFRLLTDTVFEGRKHETDWALWARLARVDLDDVPRTRFSHASMAITAAIAGQGVALGRTSLVGIELAEHRLVQPFGPEFLSPYAYWIVAPHGRITLPRVAAFVDWLTATIDVGAAWPRTQTARPVG